MAQQPKTIFQGNSKTFPLSVVQESDGQAVDLTGASIEFEVKTQRGGGDPAAIIVAGTITDAANGLAEIALDPSHTKDLDPGLYRYDVVLVTAASKRYTIIPPSDFRILSVVNQAP